MSFREQFNSNEKNNKYFREYREKNREKIREYGRKYIKEWRIKLAKKENPNYKPKIKLSAEKQKIRIIIRLLKKILKKKKKLETINRKYVSTKIYVDYKKEGRDFIREKIRIRDNNTCQFCGKKWQIGMRKLDVHHIDCDNKKSQKYDNFEKEKNNMITLCHKCHLNLPEHKQVMSLTYRTTLLSFSKVNKEWLI